jgi:hypothetical protein
MRRIFLLSAVLIQVIGTILLIAIRLVECGALYIQCVQQHSSLNVAALATVFLLFWIGFFGAFNRIGALFFTVIFLITILIADILFLADGISGSRMYTSINAENPSRTVYLDLFTQHYFIYNLWLLACIGFVVAALYMTVAELKKRKPEYT